MAKSASSRLLAELERVRVSLDRIDGRIESVLSKLNALEARLSAAGTGPTATQVRDASKRLH